MVTITLEAFELQSVYELLDQPGFKKIARVVFKDDYKAWKKEVSDEDKSWAIFFDSIHEVFEDDQTFLDKLMPAYIEMKEYKCADYEWFYKGSDYERIDVIIVQAIPQTEQDLHDFIYLYMKKIGNEEMSELVSEVLIPHKSARIPEEPSEGCDE